MTGNDAYFEGAAITERSDDIASHWALELQDTLLDVAAAMGATEQVRTSHTGKPAAERLALTLHWTSREQLQRTI